MNLGSVKVGRVTGHEIGINRDGTSSVLLLRVEMSEERDVQTVELARGVGMDCAPPVGSLVSVLQAGGAWKIAVAADDRVVPSGLVEGELEIYSSSDSSKVTQIRLDNADLGDGFGTVHINNGTDYAVRFSALKTAFDELNDKFNTLISAYNAHTHTESGGGVTTSPVVTPPAVAPTASAADIDPAKVDDVRVTEGTK